MKDEEVLNVQNYSSEKLSASPRLRASASSKIGLLFETQAKADGFRFVAGVDEVGRGCLAGCVVAAAVVLDLEKPLPEGLNDSKKLSAKTKISSTQLLPAKSKPLFRNQEPLLMAPIRMR